MRVPYPLGSIRSAAGAAGVACCLAMIIGRASPTAAQLRPHAPLRRAARNLAAAPGGPGTVMLTLGAPRQVLQPGQFGMNVPDMHTAVVQGPAPCALRTPVYCLYVTGVIGGAQGLGSTALLTTSDFGQAAKYAAPAGVTQPIFRAPCRMRNAPLACRLRFDSGYRGANLVFQVGGRWAMIYHGETRTFTDPGGRSQAFGQTPAYAEIGLARSGDGIHWDSGVAVVSGADPKPSLSQVAALKGLYGTPEPGALVANGYVYVFFPYMPSPGSPDANQAITIQAARASLAGIGPSGYGSWSKYDGSTPRSWRQPGMGGRGAAVVGTSGCTRPSQPWVGYSTPLKRYVMLVVCSEGWFFSSATDLDLEDWSPLVQVYKPAYPEFTKGKPVEDNVAMVTPGYTGGIIGGSGDIVYAHDDSWGTHPSPRSLWVMPFTLTTGTIQRCPPPRTGKAGTCT